MAVKDSTGAVHTTRWVGTTPIAACSPSDVNELGQLSETVATVSCPKCARSATSTPTGGRAQVAPQPKPVAKATSVSLDQRSAYALEEIAKWLKIGVGWFIFTIVLSIIGGIIWGILAAKEQERLEEILNNDFSSIR